MSYSGLKMFVMRARNYRNVNRHLERPPERDYIREHRGEFQRERQRELEQKRRIEQREREREREINRYRNRAVRDGSPGSEEVSNILERKYKSSGERVKVLVT